MKSEKLVTIWDKNQLNRQQMVLFECPRIINLWEFAMKESCPLSSHSVKNIRRPLTELASISARYLPWRKNKWPLPPMPATEARQTELWPQSPDIHGDLSIHMVYTLYRF